MCSRANDANSGEWWQDRMQRDMTHTNDVSEQLRREIEEDMAVVRAVAERLGLHTTR